MVSRCGLGVVLLAGVALWLVAASVAEARLGETLAQLKARFGEPQYTRSIDTPAAKEYVFMRKDGMRVYAHIRDSVCESITYARPFGEKMTDKQVRQLLEANGGLWIPEKNPTWEIVKGRKAQEMWRREDNKAWAETSGIFRELSVMTFEWIKAENDAKTQKALDAAKPQKLNGF